MILARRTSPAGRERELAKPSSCSRRSASKTNAAFGRPIAIGTSIVHRRCPDSQQYYCQLFMGQNTRSQLILVSLEGEGSAGRAVAQERPLSGQACREKCASDCGGHYAACFEDFCGIDDCDYLFCYAGGNQYGLGWQTGFWN